MTQLEQEVLGIIEEVTESKYTGRFKVLVDGNIYQLFLYLDREFTPIVFGMEGTEDEFKDFIRKEFRTRKIEKVKFYKITREPIPLDVLDCEETNNWDDE